MPRYAPVHSSLAPRARKGMSKAKRKGRTVQPAARPTETIKAEDVRIDFDKVPVGAPTQVPQACAHRGRMYFRHKKSALYSIDSSSTTNADEYVNHILMPSHVVCSNAILIHFTRYSDLGGVTRYNDQAHLNPACIHDAVEITFTGNDKYSKRNAYAPINQGLPVIMFARLRDNGPFYCFGQLKLIDGSYINNGGVESWRFKTTITKSTCSTDDWKRLRNIFDGPEVAVAREAGTCINANKGKKNLNVG